MKEILFFILGNKSKKKKKRKVFEVLFFLNKNIQRMKETLSVQ